MTSKFKVGDEVTIITSSGELWKVVHILQERFRGNGWVTDGERWWTRSGLANTKSAYRSKIVPTTEEHRRAIWLRNTRRALSRESVWAEAPEATIDAVVKLLGWEMPKQGETP